MRHTLEKYKGYSPIKVNGKRIIGRSINESAKQQDEEESEEEVFLINTCHARGERNTLKEVIKSQGWKETKATGEGNILWYYTSLREIDLKILNFRKCMFNRYPRASVICRKRQFHIVLK